MANLLIETHLFEGRVNEDESGRTIVKGILQRAGAENQNGRIYPKPILMREAKKYETLIKERRALGELDHPDSSVINLKNVSHNVREIHWDNDDLVGTVEILPTPSGNILKELLKAGILLCFLSSNLDWMGFRFQSINTWSIYDSNERICEQTTSRTSSSL